MRYEDLVRAPDSILRDLLSHLNLPHERLFPFALFRLLHGGDYKIRRHRDISPRSQKRHERQLSPEQRAVLDRYIDTEMCELGYRDLDAASSRPRSMQGAEPTRAVTAFCEPLSAPGHAMSLCDTA